MTCGVGRRCGSDAVLLWLWCRLAAVPPIRPLAWEPPRAVGMALKKKQKTKNKQKKRYNNPKPMGFSKNRFKREVYINTSLPQEIRKISNKQPNFTTKATKEEQTKHKVSKRKENMKIKKMK